jgi:hypothetical protein
MAHADALLPKIGASTEHDRVGFARPNCRRMARQPGGAGGAARPRRGVSGPYDRKACQHNRKAYRNALHRGDLQAANGTAVCATGLAWQRCSLSPTRVRDHWFDYGIAVAVGRRPCSRASALGPNRTLADRPRPLAEHDRKRSKSEEQTAGPTFAWVSTARDRRKPVDKRAHRRFCLHPR